LPEKGELTIFVDDVRVATMSLGATDDGPVLSPAECAIFEREHRGFCLDVDDRSARLRATLDRSARVVATLAGERRTLLAPGGRVDVLLPLSPGCPHDLALELVAFDGRTLSARLVLVAENDLAPVHLVESLPNPRGAEPAQEYVELLNSSDARVDL